MSSSISNTKVTSSLNVNERPKSTGFYENQKRYPRLQTLSSQYEDKIRKQREKDSMMSSRTDTTYVLVKTKQKHYYIFSFDI